MLYDPVCDIDKKNENNKIKKYSGNEYKDFGQHFISSKAGGQADFAENCPDSLRQEDRLMSRP